REHELVRIAAENARQLGGDVVHRRRRAPADDMILGMRITWAFLKTLGYTLNYSWINRSGCLVVGINRPVGWYPLPNHGIALSLFAAVSGRFWMISPGR